MVWSTAHSAPTQALPIREKPITSKRKLHILDGENHDHSLGEVEKRISKRAKVPQSSINILSFRGRDNPTKGRGHRSESAKQDVQGLALAGRSCTHCVHIKKKCDKQVPCAMCAKFWNRYSTGTLPKAKRINCLSPDRSYDTALQTKLALRHIHDEMTAIRSSTSSLPKLLSIRDGLKPSQKRLMQSLLMNLQRRIQQDLGCYFYIVMIMGRTQSLQNPAFETSSSHDILGQWHILEASALFFACNKVHMPQYSHQHTLECHIVHHFFGVHTPRLACTAHQLRKKTNERLKEKYTDLLGKHDTWPLRVPQFSLLLELCEHFPDAYFLPPLPGNVMDSRFNLRILCRQRFYSGVDGACVHVYETAMGSYIISVDSDLTLYRFGTLIAPFRIARSGPFAQMLQATGWLNIPSIRPLEWGVPVIDGWASIIAAHYTKRRAARWWIIPSLRCSDWNFNRSCHSNLHPSICLDDVRLALSTFHMIIKSELRKLELELESELQQLEVEHGGCSCAFCVPW
ncbi:hypothetical protein BKA58DRAFT_373756 [Alternaria rosae]|uniref:uncharacterized protein n=1 Tax=Alternaria rosae TaxID=1187941 RepID=UPI001E8E5089|nr:uncharacterized protein BKA58DRAFT_373756 [Alternaria rosae]KAH6882698.1 hypothetical protein BKA58DRAFT_373756 [Alternaria rosae]